MTHDSVSRRHADAERATAGRAASPGRSPAARSLGPAAVLAFQRTAGNVAVTRMLARAELQRSRMIKGSGTFPLTVAVEFTVGADVSLDLVTTAKEAASGGVADAELRRLRDKALADETINDDERMFLAGLLDPANARQVARARIVAGTRLTFSRTSIETNMAHARDFDQQAIDPAVAEENAASTRAAAVGDKTGAAQHHYAAHRAAVGQMHALVGPTSGVEGHGRGRLGSAARDAAGHPGGDARRRVRRHAGRPGAGGCRLRRRRRRATCADGGYPRRETQDRPDHAPWAPGGVRVVSRDRRRRWSQGRHDVLSGRARYHQRHAPLDDHPRARACLP